MHYTYVLRCRDNELYVRSTEDLKRRFQEHVCGYVIATSYRRPVQLIYYEACLKKESACNRERYFKTGYGREFLKKRPG